MAIYHLSAQVIGRKSGGNAKAAAAYRAGEKIEKFDYTRKTGVDYKEVLTPENAPEWCSDRVKLWSAVEDAEKRKDAQVCREINLALPLELKPAEREMLLKEFANHFTSLGMVADITIHGQVTNNPHGHIMLTTRELTSEGFGQKVRDWNRRELLGEWRSHWEELTNKALAIAGHEVRIDHRTLDAQGIDREPTRHKGKVGTWLERKEPTLIGELHHQLAEQAKNAHEITLCHLELAQLDKEVAKELQEATQGQEWIYQRQILRQKEKEADKAAEAFFEQAKQYEGKNAFFEAQKKQSKLPLWEKFLYNKEKDIDNFTKQYQELAIKYVNEGNKLQAQAKAYAEEGLKIALAHPDARDRDDHVTIACMENLHREEQERERQKQEKIKIQKAHEELENSGYRGELNRLAKIVKPNIVQWALDEWKKPYLELIKKSNEDKKVVEWCINKAKYDTTPEGQAELREIEYALGETLKCTGWSLSKKETFVKPAMDTIRISPNRQEALKQIAYGLQKEVSRELNRGRGR